MYYTYTHAKPDGSVFYVGKGKGRRSQAKCGRNKHWHHIVNKYGNFIVQIVGNNYTNDEAEAHEILLIAYYLENNTQLTNYTTGGGSGCEWTEEAKNKHSARLLGHFVSEETKNKISKALKGKPKSKEAVEKSRAIQKGRKRDPIQVEKSALAHRGMKRSQETKDKMKAAWTARKQKGLDK